MTILNTTLTIDEITLVTDIPIARFILSYGRKLETSYSETGLNTTTLTITKETLGLTTLDNSYFKLEVFDSIDNSAGVGLYNLEIINELEAELYNANNLKQDLDNLNFYDGILQILNNSNQFLTANDVFFNYKNFLENEINANNFLRAIGRQD